jgi:hypothetical protein
MENVSSLHLTVIPTLLARIRVFVRVFVDSSLRGDQLQTFMSSIQISNITPSPPLSPHRLSHGKLCSHIIMQHTTLTRTVDKGGMN